MQFFKNSNWTYHAQVSRDNWKNKKKKIRRIELLSREISPKNRRVKLLFAILPYKSNESRAVSFLEKEQVVTGRNKEDQMDQSDSSVESWTAEAAQWYKQKTCVLS